MSALKTDKRQRDWLLGRWTAKQLIRTVLQDRGHAVPLNGLHIDNHPSGEPYFQFASDADWLSFPLTLSISHSNSTSFCAVTERPSWPLGADIERIEPRHPSFVSDYFTGAERGLVSQTDPALLDTHVTAIWSAKEAVLKAMHVGLRVDTRSVSCLIESVKQRPLSWTPFEIRVDEQHPFEYQLAGWWRTHGNFVLTVAIAHA